MVNDDIQRGRLCRQNHIIGLYGFLGSTKRRENIAAQLIERQRLLVEAAVGRGMRVVGPAALGASTLRFS